MLHDTFRSMLFLLVLGILSLSYEIVIGQTSGVYSQKDSIQLVELLNHIEQLSENDPADSIGYYYQKKVDLHRQKDDLTEWLNTYWEWQYYFDEPELSLELIDDCLSKMWRRANIYSEWESLLWTYASKGYLHFELGEVMASVRALQQAESIFSTKKITDFNIVEYVYQLMGTCLTMIGDNEKARYIYEKALRHTDSYDIKGGLYNNIGLTFWNEGNNKQAILEYQKGLSIDSLPLIRRGQLMSNLAKSMQETGLNEEALRTAQSAVSSLTSIKESAHSDYEEWLSGAYYILGFIYANQENFGEAQLAFEQALQHAIIAYGSKNHRTSAKIFIALGDLAVQKGFYKMGINRYHEALSCVIPSFLPKNLMDRPSSGLFYEENTIAEALEGKAEALYLLFEKEADLTYLKEALTCHELAFKAENLLRQVMENESAKLLLQLYRRNRTEKVLHIAHQLFMESGEEEYLQKAFIIAERSKASLLLDNIRENLAKSAIQLQDSLFIEERQLLRYYSFYEKEYLLSRGEAAKNRFLFEKNKVGEQLENLRGEIRKKYPSIGAVSEQELSFKQVEQWLENSDTEGLVEYFVGEKHLYIFSLKKGGKIELRVLEQNPELQSIAQTFIQRFGSRERISNEREEYLKEAYYLFSILLGKLDLLNGTSFTIIPDAWLNFLPFEALISVPYSGNWSKAPFLIKKWTIGYGYSLATLFYQKNLPSEAEKNLLAVAPGFDKQPRNLPPLGFSREELKAIRIPQDKKLVDQAALLESFRLESSNYLILHLSTHAQGTGTDVPPHIEFIDSTLYLPEIYALRLKADLVTLSACETGMGQLEEGEGVMSLSRGFAFAGAASLIASLWTVNEASTAELFAQFYKDIAGGLPKMEALRQTKLKYLEAPNIPSFQKSPYYWAGFVYYGNEGTISLKRSRNVSWERILLYGLLPGILVGLFMFFRKKRKTH